jgi:hypothetical protein
MSTVALPDVASDTYHADDLGTPEPSCNSTTARLLLTRTPAHAKAQHPRLSDVPLEPRTSAAMDMGTAVHQLLLRDDRVEVADFKDYKKGEAQAWRDATRAEGRIPMLTHQWERAQAIAAAVREQMLGLPKPTPFTAGTPEATITWQDTDGAWCRARLDWLRDDLQTIDDLKCTSRTADPKVWVRQLFNYGYDVQAAFYIRGVEKLHGVRPRFRWVVAETAPPYAVQVVELSEQAMAAANVKVDAALSIWNECMAAGSWPAYAPDVYVAEVPGWQKPTEDAWADVDLEAVPF